jgi:hypothetical protein
MRLFRDSRFLFILVAFLGKLSVSAQSPTIVTNDVSGAMACAGVNISVSFTASNLINPTKRQFTVQLSNVGGAFTSPTSLGTASASPITVTLPATAIGGDYRLRVITDTTGVTATPSAVFMMLKRPAAALVGDTTINVGGTATLTLTFSGNGPWTYTFTNTNTGTTSLNPLKGNVSPTVSTTYVLQSVSNVCGTGTVSGTARVKVIPRITTTFATPVVCANATTSIPFTLTGAFDTTGVRYTAQLSDAAGNFTTPLTIGTGTASPIAVTFPRTLTSGSAYKVRVISNATSTTVSSNAFSVSPLPTASLSGATTITVGESAKLNLTFTGESPWTYVLSNDQTATVTTNPAVITVSPTVTTAYTVKSIRNACGNGNVSPASVQVIVLPRISVADVALGSICVGTSVSLPFTITGTFETPVTYTAQLSDALGSFSTPQNLGTGNSSPINITIPTNLNGGAGYRLRVIASTNATSVNSPVFEIKGRPTAVLSGNPTVNFGENAPLTLNFTGESPWTVVLSDGTTATAERTPFVMNVKPTQTSSYTVSSVRNLCGQGVASGVAQVTVIPRILTENFAAAVCLAKDFDVKFSIGGSLAANTVFRAQLSDSTGSFANAITIGTGSNSPIIANIPATTPIKGNYTVRVIAVGNSVITSIPTTPFVLARKPMATLSGGTTAPLKPGEEILLVVQFSGDAPWSYTLSDNTTGKASTTPVILAVSPTLPITYTLKSVSNTCGEGTVSGSVVANIVITSLADLVKENLLVFPNPIAEQLKIRISLSGVSEWELVDLQGRAWQNRRWLNGSNYEETINTESLPAGSYIFRVKISDKWFDKKIVKI